MIELLRFLATRRHAVNFAYGFSSGLPLLLTGSTLSAWMTDEGVNLTVIGLFALVGTPYTLKFLWAPLIDRYPLPFLTRRRGWIFLCQWLVALSLLGMSVVHPSASPGWTAALAFATAFFSATQDIAIDAYRRENIPEPELGIGVSAAIASYRIAILVSGAFALYLADQIPWHQVYASLAGLMATCSLVTIFAPEIQAHKDTLPQSLQEAAIAPFQDFFRRSGAWVILSFILFYKLGDTMAGTMLTPFLLKAGFTKTQYAAIVKTFGLFSLLAGGFIGGGLLYRTSRDRALWICGILQIASTACFAILRPEGGNSETELAALVAFENLSAGMGGAVYSAYMASLCNVRYSATQYALLSSLMSASRSVFSAPTGFLAQLLGFQSFFILCAAIGLPGLWLIRKLK